jgi:hypothetical protein
VRNRLKCWKFTDDRHKVLIILICICPFLVAFFSATIDGRNLIFGHKLYIGIPYCGKRFLTRQIPTSCLPKSRGYRKWALAHRFLPSIVAEKNATKNEHICSMCIKINKVSKQEVGIWWVQKRFPRYGVPIWSFLFIIPTEGEGGILFYLCPSVRPRYFLSHFSQQLLIAEIWYLVTSFI